SFTFDEMQALRPQLAKLGLRATLRGRPLAESAERILTFAQGGLSRRKRLSKEGKDETVHLAALSTLVEHARCPADDLVHELPSNPQALRAEIVRRTQL